MRENRIIDYIKRTVFFATLFLVAYMMLTIDSKADPDLWHRMAVGSIFSQTGSVAYHDMFSYFPTNSLWVDHEWLSGIIFYQLGQRFGDVGITALQVTIAFSILTLIYNTNKLLFPEKKRRIMWYFAIFSGVFIGLCSTLRCQSYTYLFFTLWIYLLERIRKGENRLICLFPATMLLWSNMHGGFLAGIGLVCFYAIGEFLNKKIFSQYLLILALLIPATIITPYGIDYWTYIFKAVTLSREYITEWMPFNPFADVFEGIGYKLMFLAAVFGYGYKMFKKDMHIDMAHAVALLATLYLGLKHQRHTVFFCIVAGCFVYPYFAAFVNATVSKIEDKFAQKLDADIAEKLYFVRECLFYTFIILISAYVISSKPLSIGMSKYPVKAIEFIKINNLSGNLFVPFNWGSYSLWRLYPQNLVSFDGRFEEAYEIQSYYDEHNIEKMTAEGLQSMNKYHHDVFLVYAKSRLYNTLKAKPEWRLVYETDETAAVFVPSSIQQTDWLYPPNEAEYYVKTKYRNSIRFNGT